MIDVHVVAVLLGLHFISDFIFQTNEQAVNKSKSNAALAAHVGTYSIPFLIFGPVFWLVTFVTHFATDYITSRVVAKFAKEEKRKQMFMTIGFDQLIHGLTLLYTFYILNAYQLIPMW